MKMDHLKKYILSALLSAAIFSVPLNAKAAITIFSGEDDGAPVGGPFTNSNSAQSTFLSSATGFGPVRTETFQEFSVGAGGGGGTLPITGGSMTLVTPFGIPFGGVNNDNSGNLFGFALPGETNWLGFADGSVTFNFSHPTNSFGFYTTGVQSVFTTDIVVTFNDGTNMFFHPAINVGGGATYFGLTDTSSFSSISIADISNDAWGISDVSFNFISTVPEPATWAFLLLGFFGTGALIRRSRGQRALSPAA